MSQKGFIKFWSLPGYFDSFLPTTNNNNNLEPENKPEEIFGAQEIFPIQTLDLNLKVARSLHVSPNNSLLLCVGAGKWVVCVIFLFF